MLYFLCLDRLVGDLCNYCYSLCVIYSCVFLSFFFSFFVGVWAADGYGGFTTIGNGGLVVVALLVVLYSGVRWATASRVIGDFHFAYSEFASRVDFTLRVVCFWRRLTRVGWSDLFGS